MAVKIRLSRIGKKHVPFFRIIAIDSRKKRDGAYLENLGTYDVLGNKFVQFHEERLNDWVSKGAVVTDSVKKLQPDYLEIDWNNPEKFDDETRYIITKIKNNYDPLHMENYLSFIHNKYEGRFAHK